VAEWGKLQTAFQAEDGMSRDQNDIRIRPGKGRGRSSGRQSGLPRWLPSFTDQPRQAVRRQGHPVGTGSRMDAQCRGRGAKVAAGLKGRNAWSCTSGPIPSPGISAVILASSRGSGGR
jgi:hypothetical protein